MQTYYDGYSTFTYIDTDYAGFMCQGTFVFTYMLFLVQVMELFFIGLLLNKVYVMEPHQTVTTQTSNPSSNQSSNHNSESDNSSEPDNDQSSSGSEELIESDQSSSESEEEVFERPVYKRRPSVVSRLIGQRNRFGRFNRFNRGDRYFGYRERVVLRNRMRDYENKINQLEQTINDVRQNNEIPPLECVCEDVNCGLNQ
jgi:hypothetical protein